MRINRFTFPKVVQIEITNRCPFHCHQCYKTKLSMEDMPFDKLIELVNDCISQGTNLFVLNGGEPFLYPQILPTIEYLTEKKVYFNCFTSGYGLTEEIIECVKKGYMQLNISLNGSTKEINELSREGYSYAIDAIKILNEKKAPYMINWVARHDNVHDFPAMVQLALKYNAKAISVIGNKMAHNQFIDSPMDLEDYRFLADYINHFSDYDKIGITIEQCFPVLSALIPSLPKTSLNGCLAGIFNCNVTLDGYFMPCTQMQYKEKFNNINDYWENSEILKKLRAIRKESLAYCKDCQMKYCRTCRAVSRECHDDFSMGYRLCPIRNQ